MIRRTWTKPAHAAVPTAWRLAFGAALAVSVFGAMELLLRIAG